MITKVTTDVKLVTRTYHFEALAKVKTMMQLTGPCVVQLDELFEELNSSWIAEVSQSFAHDRFETLRDWPSSGWDEVVKLGGNCEVEDADLDLDIVEPEPEPEPELVVYVVEYCDYNDPEQYKPFKTLAEAEQFADEYLIKCMDEKQLADMKERGVTPRGYVDLSYREKNIKEFAYAFIAKHIL